MTNTRRLLKGTFILTAAGVCSRIMGFFFRIFLSHIFGEEQVGLYQLIFPFYILCLSLSTAGIQTALSRLVAEKISLREKDQAVEILYTSLFFTVFLSLAECLLIQQYAEFISLRFLGDVRCTELLRTVSYALPAASVHSCIYGYNLGIQKAAMPAISQLAEQAARILSVLLLFWFLQKTSNPCTIQIAVSGVIIGEYLAALYSVWHFYKVHWSAACPSCISSHPAPGSQTCCTHSRFTSSPAKSRHQTRPAFPSDHSRRCSELLKLSVPLTLNRSAVTLLQSIESVSVPACLKLCQYSDAEALSIYGVLTGMALPCILFPSAVTSSVSMMLMPAVAGEQAAGKHESMMRLILRAATSCFLLGLLCCIFFLLFGTRIGNLLFHSELAGRFILTLAWICPFLYTNTALTGTINGLGNTGATLFINIAGLSIRILSIITAVPRFGIQGYLWGLLASQILVSLLSLAALYKLTSSDKNTARRTVL